MTNRELLELAARQLIQAWADCSGCPDTLAERDKISAAVCAMQAALSYHPPATQADGTLEVAVRCWADGQQFETRRIYDQIELLAVRDSDALVMYDAVRLKRSVENSMAVASAADQP